VRRPRVRARPGLGPPRSHPRPLRTAQEPAKSHPRPLRAPGAAWGRPRRPKNIQNYFKERPKSRPGPRAPQEGPGSPGEALESQGPPGDPKEGPRSPGRTSGEALEPHGDQARGERTRGDKSRQD